MFLLSSLSTLQLKKNDGNKTWEILRIHVSFTQFICYCCTNMLLVFRQRYKSSLKKQKQSQLQLQPVTVDSCSEKRYSKNLGQILEKKFGGVLFQQSCRQGACKFTNKLTPPQVLFKEKVTCYVLEFQEQQVSRISFSGCF